MEKWKAEVRFPLSHGHDGYYWFTVFATVARRTRPARSSYVHRGYAHDRWAQLMQSTIHHYNGTGYTLHAYVIMPDHLHILMTPIESIEKAMQLIKGGFSFRAKREFNWQEEIWQPGFTDHRIRDAVDWQRHIDYIRTNPIEAKLTSETDLYVFMNLLQKEVPHELKTGAIH